MEYAIVRFTNEQDSPGIISKKWIVEGTNDKACWFPDVPTEFQKNKLLFTHTSPRKKVQWKICAIRILKFYATYQIAKAHLEEAEQTSNLESDAELPRLRKKRKHTLSDGRSQTKDDCGLSSEDESSESLISTQQMDPYPQPPLSSSITPSYPVPPTVLTSVLDFSSVETSAKASSQIEPQPSLSSSSLTFSSLPPVTPLATSHPLPPLSSSLTFSSLPITSLATSHPPPSLSSSSTFSYHLPITSLATSHLPPSLSLPLTLSSTPHPPMASLNSGPFVPPSTLSAAEFSQNSPDQATTLAEILAYQKGVFSMLKDLIDSNKKLETKIDSLITNKLQPEQDSDDEFSHFITSIPLGFDEFVEFDKKIVESPAFKKRLITFCLTIGGKDAKLLVCNLMRKLIADEVGEKYSLTGKSSIVGVSKHSFEKTQTYRLILDICFRNFKDARTNTLRETVSDWLTQSKFRKNKREKRAEISRELQPPSV